MQSLAITTGTGIGPIVVQKAISLLSVDIPLTVYGTTPPPLELPPHITWKTFSGKTAPMDALMSACDMLTAKQHDALITGPLSKNDFIRSDSNPNQLNGHTEILAKRFNSNTCMSFLNSTYRMGLVTQHIPLRDVADRLSESLIVGKGMLFGAFLKKHTGKTNVKFGVCGLNPHGATDLYPNSEEVAIVKPACETLREVGFDIDGPISPDSAFFQYKKFGWDGVLSLYHDQGLPFLKGIRFRDTVNVTLGLPFIRTSVDHGTADGLSSDACDETNMLRAIEWAILLSEK
jgi:4-hydroxythreonine-4-phosphate dehydrogenase